MTWYKITSKWVKRCYLCGGTIAVGDLAMWRPVDKAMRHPDCVERRPERVLPEPIPAPSKGYGFPMATQKTIKD